MRRTLLKSKIHRATVTDANLHYEGSLTIDRNLMDAADILPNEQIHVWDVTTGARLITYALEGERGSGVICVNGAGAHLMKKGDIIIIATFTIMKTKLARKYRPAVVLCDAANRMKEDDSPEMEALPTLNVVAIDPKPTRRKRSLPADDSGTK